jgi:hypothetical protein
MYRLCGRAQAGPYEGVMTGTLDLARMLGWMWKNLTGRYAVCYFEEAFNEPDLWFRLKEAT